MYLEHIAITALWSAILTDSIFSIAICSIDFESVIEEQSVTDMQLHLNRSAFLAKKKTFHRHSDSHAKNYRRYPIKYYLFGVMC